MPFPVRDGLDQFSGQALGKKIEEMEELVHNGGSLWETAVSLRLNYWPILNEARARVVEVVTLRNLGCALGPGNLRQYNFALK
jgi:hypothetical protein